MAGERFLVVHDYGMGGVWWWVRARSAREILETFAEVEVVESAAAIERAEGWDLDETAVDAPTLPPGLDGLRAERDAQRGRPGFAALADRSIVHLRKRWDGGDGTDPAVYVLEVDRDGRRLRQVEISEDGDAVKSDQGDWPFNPPLFDLFDPELKDAEITREEFETAWQRARRED